MKRRLDETAAELDASRASVAHLESRLALERRLRAGLQLSADAAEVYGEHVRELEGRYASLESEVVSLVKAITHVTRKLRTRERSDGGGSASARAAFGVDMENADGARFFCFKFWQQLSSTRGRGFTPPPENARHSPATPNPLLFRFGEGGFPARPGGTPTRKPPSSPPAFK